jgi:hypothetical protein
MYVEVNKGKSVRCGGGYWTEWRGESEVSVGLSVSAGMRENGREIVIVPGEWRGGRELELVQGSWTELESGVMRAGGSWADDGLSVRSLASIGIGSTDGKKLTITRLPASPSHLLALSPTLS